MDFVNVFPWSPEGGKYRLSALILSVHTGKLETTHEITLGLYNDDEIEKRYDISNK